MTEEDAGVLKWSGLMGHEYTAITGEPGKRQRAGEFNTLDSAKQHCGGPGRHLKVYAHTGKKRRKWLEVYDQDNHELAMTIIPNDPSKPASH